MLERSRVPPAGVQHRTARRSGTRTSPLQTRPASGPRPRRRCIHRTLIALSCRFSRIQYGSAPIRLVRGDLRRPLSVL
jgi:hypothetical protein